MERCGGIPPKRVVRVASGEEAIECRSAGASHGAGMWHRTHSVGQRFYEAIHAQFCLGVAKGCAVILVPKPVQ